MKTLYVLRHGHAVPEAEAVSDHARELTARGRAEVGQSAQHLAGRAGPTLVVSSTAARAKQTAQIAVSALPPATPLMLKDELYLAEPASYLGALAAGGDPHGSVMVVGHNPGLEALVYQLTERSEHLATASLVEIELPLTTWKELSGSSLGIGRVVAVFRAR
jgi:phosphohistidine phosphatase